MTNLSSGVATDPVPAQLGASPMFPPSTEWPRCSLSYDARTRRCYPLASPIGSLGSASPGSAAASGAMPRLPGG